MKKILFFGNIPTDDDRSIGGATVLAKNIYFFLKNDSTLNIFHSPIRNHWNKYGQVIDYLKLIFKSPFLFYKYDVISFHATSDFHFTIAPIVWLWAKILKKRIIYHFFGGIFHERFEKKSWIHKWLMRKTFLNSDILFLETKMMINQFKDEGFTNCVWLPNSREEVMDITPKVKFEKRFVFISRVTPTKGINEILMASKKLPKDFTLHIYGPLDMNYYTKTYFDNLNVEYKGILKSDKVTSVLSKYDVLLLPTFHEGEGYPGIIIESLSLGIPVISTRWRSIPEIINKYNGILIEPKNHIELENAIQSINKENYGKYQAEALKSFKDFSSDFVFKKIVKAYLS